MKRHISFVCFFIVSVLIALPCKVLFAQGGGSQYGPPQLKIIVDPETPVEEPGGEDPPPHADHVTSTVQNLAIKRQVRRALISNAYTTLIMTCIIV